MHTLYSRGSIRRRAAGLVSLMAVVIVSPSTTAQSVPEPETRSAVRLALERLPRYGVFDSLGFRLEGGAVTLEGYAYGPWLGRDATAAVERLPGVAEVANGVETLPVSKADDRIRWMTFYQIYTDDGLARYAPGGAVGARFDAFQFGGFPGTQPAGYSIHIIVNRARTTLVGVVDNAADRQIAEVRAREVPGVFAVDNRLVVAR